MLTHNSPFELMKTALMNFLRSYRDAIPGALSLDRTNADGMITTSLMQPISSYKYLEAIFIPKLRWTLQHKKVPAVAAFWASCIGHLSKLASGLSTMGAKQLYNIVAVLRFSYGTEVWYTHVHKPPGSAKSKGSVSITNRLRTAQ